MAKEPLPPMILPSGEITTNLLGASRAVKGRMFQIFAKLEAEHEQQHGVTRLEQFAKDNYADFLKLLSKNMAREPEAVSDGKGVEDLLEELDKRAAAAKVVPSGTASPASSEPPLSLPQSEDS